MELTYGEKQLKQIAGYLGCLQAFAWVILSLICIVLYNIDKTFDNISSYGELLEALLYTIFLKRGEKFFNGQILTANVFIIFVSIYFVTHLLWLGLSIKISDNNYFNYKTLEIWNVITWFISIFDMITVIILATDYQNCLNTSDILLSQMYCANGILPILLLVARGFVLWIINIIFTVIMKNLARKLKQVPPETGSSLPSVLIQPRPRPTLLPIGGYNQYPALGSSPIATPNGPQNSPFTPMKQLTYPVQQPQGSMLRRY